ncbi:MAG: hypothetical protein LUK37_08530, partial [Clostridia bacterium]|nr:hypothetical protein [Clostridia bacterium]
PPPPRPPPARPPPPPPPPPAAPPPPLSILEELYEGKTPEAIKAHPMRFLDYISDDVIYSEIKENGLLKCYQILARA